MKRHTVAVLLAILLVIPTAPVLFAFMGGGALGGVSCILLGMVTSAATLRVVYGVVEFHSWIKHRNVQIEAPKPMPVPTHTAYEIDWTKINEGDKL